MTSPILPDYMPVPQASLGPAVNDQGYYAGRVERNLYWVTDGDYHSAFLATRDGVVLFDAPPTIGHNLQRAVDQAAAAEGVSNTVTHLIYTHHHSDHAGGSSIFGTGVVRIGHCPRDRGLDYRRPADPPDPGRQGRGDPPPRAGRRVRPRLPGRCRSRLDDPDPRGRIDPGKGHQGRFTGADAASFKRRTPVVSLRSPALRRR